MSIKEFREILAADHHILHQLDISGEELVIGNHRSSGGDEPFLWVNGMPDILYMSHEEAHMIALALRTASDACNPVRGA